MAGRDTKAGQGIEMPASMPADLGQEWPTLSVRMRTVVAEAFRKLEASNAKNGKSSSNSSKPSSTDSPKEKAKTNEKRRGRRGRRRRPGGQKGHPGHERPLVPPERVDERKEVRPLECRRCHHDIRKVAPQEEPLLHQIAEIPEIRPLILEYALHRILCPECGTTTTASLPEGVSECHFGPYLRAVLMLLSGRYRISRRETGELCQDLFGLSISVGTVANILDDGTSALKEPYDELAVAAKQEKVAYMDETGWREKGKQLYLWILVVSFCVLFRIGRRTREVAQEMLGKGFAGRLGTDRYVVYLFVANDRHQVCWPHLRRDFQGLIDRGGGAKVIGEAAVKIHDALFRIWHANKDGRISWKQMQRRMAKVERRMGALLQAGSSSKSAEARSLCNSLIKIECCLFVFSRAPGIEPTNNISERGVRPAVQWRKICFGTQSSKGSRFVERIMTVAATCRLQRRPLLPYLRAVIEAMDAGKKIPSLLPEQAVEHQAQIDSRKAG